MIDKSYEKYFSFEYYHEGKEALEKAKAKYEAEKETLAGFVTRCERKN